MVNRHALKVRAFQLLGPLIARVHRDLRCTDIPRSTSQLRIPTRAGSVRCTVYRPSARPDGSAPPVYVNFHGGGFVLRRHQADDHICRFIADRAGCVVVNVDYDVAPTHPFPAATTQAYDVTAWVAAHGAESGWDGTRLAVGGHSAGGNLAAGVCLTARDTKDFSLRLQILDYPPLDLAADPEAKLLHGRKSVITPALSHLFNDAYVPDLATRKDPLVSPALAPDHAGLAPALIITAEHDLLRDEGEAYADSLRAAGVPVTHRRFDGVDHAFTHAGPVEPAKEAMELMAASLRKAFA
ncbi:alpha/beta hydrolase [Streptomyces sp. NPDC047081]|uniref:alpha/beta hydrolase n=1 Tax=Streptomyces sp. NPDC047081 TaxID=3154706 RepID=UPI0033E76DAD